MVVIRFQRRGTKKTPQHRIVVTSRQRAQSSRVLEVVGHYNPATNPPEFTVDQSRVDYWLATGAQLSDSLGKLLKQLGKPAKLSAAKA